MSKIDNLDLVQIDTLRVRKSIDAYFHWKQLDAEIRTLSTRGLNFPSEISEALACYACGYLLNKGTGGDAYDPARDFIIEMKASSSTGPSSFSPKESFDELVFIKLDRYEDCIYIYLTGVNSDGLRKIKVSSTETVGDQQAKGRRPRFHIEDMIIKPRGIQPYAKFDLRNKEVIKF